MLQKQKNLVIVSVVVLIAVITGSVLLLTPKKQSPQVKEQVTEPMDEGSILPTVDPSVQVSLTATGSKKEVVLEIKNVPQGTQSIGYELSYQEKEKGLQGVIGSLSPDGQKTIKKQITLGTCSSGKCVYHTVVGSVKVNLKFLINETEKGFEKEYDI
jgi:hypothetical protein